MAFEIDERAQHLLKTLIECYVRDGQPVGSRALARDSRLDLCPATIRNVMADLEEMGMVTSPHTSAGRIPTARGYRLFVDSLITMKPLENNEVQRLKGQLEFEYSVDDLLGKASSLLSEVTHMAGLVMIPRRDQLALRHIEFLPMSEGRILAVLVINNNEVQNRIINTRRHFTPSELQQAANYLNEKFAGENLLTMRRRMLDEMRETKTSLDHLMQAAMEMAEQVFNLAPPRDDYVMTGQTKLMEFSDLSDVEKLRRLFEVFNEKRSLLDLLDQCIHSQGVQIFIGEESGYQALDYCSLVTSPYEVDGQVLGVLGVIGPTRMAYERVIPVVDVTARLLGAALNQK